MCMTFGYNPQNIFCHFFHSLNLVIFGFNYYRSLWTLDTLWAQILLQFYYISKEGTKRKTILTCKKISHSLQERPSFVVRSGTNMQTYRRGHPCPMDTFSSVLLNLSNELGKGDKMQGLFCLCCVAALKSLQAHTFVARIILILRIVCTTIPFHYYFPWISSMYCTAFKITRWPIFISVV